MSKLTVNFSDIIFQYLQKFYYYEISTCYMILDQNLKYNNVFNIKPTNTGQINHLQIFSGI